MFPILPMKSLDRPDDEPWGADSVERDAPVPVVDRYGAAYEAGYAHFSRPEPWSSCPSEADLAEEWFAGRDDAAREAA